MASLSEGILAAFPRFAQLWRANDRHPFRDLPRGPERTAHHWLFPGSDGARLLRHLLAHPGNPDPAPDRPHMPRRSAGLFPDAERPRPPRSEEHTSELQSLISIPY